MNRSAARVAWYRLRATVSRQWAGYLAITLLVGLVGGVAIAAVAGARRTQSSFPAYFASTNPSDLGVATAIFEPDAGRTAGYDPGVIATIAKLPHVKRVESLVGLDVLPLGPDGVPFTGPQAGLGGGSVDGLGFDIDHIGVIHGRTADPERADEFVIDAASAKQVGVRLGDVITFGVYSNAQTLLDGFGTAAVPPIRTVKVRLVGIGEVINSQVVLDDIDAGSSSAAALFTPAFARSMLECCTNYTLTALQLDGGSRYKATVEAEVAKALPRGLPLIIAPSSIGVAKAERAVKPEAIALAVFGGIAALAALLIGGQAIGRRLRFDADDLSVLRAIGAGPAMTSRDGLPGVVIAVVTGALLAGGVAVGLSPLAPIGPARAVDPAPGIDVDWAVVGLGVAVLIVALNALATVVGHRQAPHRVARRRRSAAVRSSTVARAASASGLSTPAVTGIRFALEPGRGRNAVPARSSILGTILAVVVVTTTVTFGASLHTLVSHPALYGWNWDYELNAGSGGGDIPEQQATDLLEHDPNVASWAGAYFGALQVDGLVVPTLGMSPGAAVGPPTLSGHGLAAPDQIVLGAATLASLHKRVSDTVDVSDGSSTPTRLRVVGTAAMPAIGLGGSLHLEVGDGALLASDLIPPSMRNPFSDPITGPNVIFVRFKDGASHKAALGSLRTIATRVSNTANFGVEVEAVRRPAEIVNYRTMGSTPALLGGALALGAVVALGLTLMSSVRRRRRDLALLKTLGLTRRQLIAVVSWQASVAAAIGVLIGVPLGIALGRQLWVVFAEQIHVVPRPTVPALTVVLIAAGAVALANLVAALPARIAARTPTAQLLRAE